MKMSTQKLSKGILVFRGEEQSQANIPIVPEHKRQLTNKEKIAKLWELHKNELKTE